MTLSNPAGVIFDMDGVLVDSAGAHLKAWRTLATENGRSVSDEQFASCFGRHNGDIVPPLFGPVTPERLAALADRKEELYRQIVRGNVPAVAGAAALVRGLERAGFRLAVGSSGPPANIRLVLAEMGLSDVIRTIVSGDDVSRGKPDPQVFSLACTRLGLDPRRCVVVEDAPVGVSAGKAAGTKVVAVLMHHPRTAFAHADFIVERLGDLRVEQVLGLCEG